MDDSRKPYTRYRGTKARRRGWTSALILVLCTGSAFGTSVDDGIGELTQSMVDAYLQLPSAQYRNSLAILDFVDESETSQSRNLGFAFSEMVAEHISRYREEFRLVERNRIESVFDEQNLQLSGLTEDSAVRIGSIVGADLLLLGSIFDVGSQLRVAVKLVDVESSEILLAESVDFPKDDLLDEAGRYIQVNHRVSLKYRYHYVYSERPDAHVLELSYDYLFDRGYFFGVNVLYGLRFVRSNTINWVDNAGVIDFDVVDESGQMIGVVLQFGKEWALSDRWTIEAAAGPMMLAYLDRTVLTRHRFNNFDYETNDSEVRPTYIFIGGDASVAAVLKMTDRWDFNLGIGYQFLPKRSEQKNIDWNDVAQATSGTVVFNDVIDVSAVYASAGASWSF